MAVLASGLSPLLVLRTLGDLGESGLVVWMSWVLIAPLLLTTAALVARRTPWPWVGLVTVHLCSLLVATLRFGHWSPFLAHGALLASMAVGVLSVVAAVGRHISPATGSDPDSVR